ncbi:MAG: hypothetical protein V4591_04770 [Bdellovibrionota bacterium]
MSNIIIKGAQEHNLKNIDLEIPKNSLVVFTGVSGSGKSSLVFDTIYAEAFRRFVDASQVPIYIMGNSVWSKVKRPRFRSITGLPPALGLSQRQGVASKVSTVGTISGVSDLFRVYYAAFGDVYCSKCDIPLRATEFTSLVQKILTEFENQKLYFIALLVEKRKGGFAKEIEKFRELGFSKLRVNGEIFDLQNEDVTIKIDPKKLNTIEVIIDYISILADKKSRIERAISQSLEYGKGILKIEANKIEYKFNTSSSCPQCGESAPKLDPRYFSHSSLGQCLTCSGVGSTHENLPNDLFPCLDCSGSRLSRDRSIARVYGKTYEEIHVLKLTELEIFVENKIVENQGQDQAKIKVSSELKRLLHTINKLNLGHLILNRAGASLSPGDLQRLRLASMISNNLTGALYIADEPCQGLTRDEVLQLAKVFNGIVKQKSSVISVEHHPTFLSQCDYVYLMGPGAGIHGGHIVSITQSNELKLPLPKAVFKINKTNKNEIALTFTNIQYRNIKIDKIKIVQGQINILRGKSGSGKSSFIDLCLLPSLLKLGAKNPEDDMNIEFDFEQFCRMSAAKELSANIVSYVKPGSMNRTSRRIVASALEVLQPLRVIFSQLPLSQVMGLTESHFSWNSKLGRCEKCEGRGYMEIPQKYAQPVRVECEVCVGSKLNSRSLSPRFKGYNLADLMNLTLEQAALVLSQQKQIVNKLNRACQFGLGYILLGQGMDSLSGGELQRLTLTLELKRANLEGVWFVLVHPSTGLHKPDIEILGKLMQEMTAKGATFVAIENREEFLNFADHVVNF